jgi:Transposase DDE domain
VIDLTQFSMDTIIAKLREINPAINWTHSKPFPKEESRWLSRYQFHPQSVHVNDDGSVRGGLSQLVASIIDFSFVRSVAADAYSIFGAPCYDPVSLFVLDLFRYLDKIPDIKHFCSILRDPGLGRSYRSFAGISDNCIPCRATFSNFRGRLGDSRYQDVFHALVSLIEKLGFLSYRIQATDGTLFPSAARYRGCCHFNDSCRSITVDNVVQKVRERVLYRIQDPPSIVPGKECRVRTECPNVSFPQDIKRPKITILSFTLENASQELSAVDSNNLMFFRVEEPLTKLGLVLRFRESNIHAILVSSFLGETPDSVRFRCPKLPYDRDARIGVRRKPSNPDKTEKIFGYNAIIATSIEPHLGIELPVGCITIAGNAQEGNQFIPLQEQIRRFHYIDPRIHLLDAKYDELHNYEFARKQGAIPLIDYNPRNEKLVRETLLQRGYDRNGWPFVSYCSLPMRPNGFDAAAQRLSFSCFKQCVKSKDPAILELYRNCSHRPKLLGFSTHVPIAGQPRLLLEIPRGTERFRQLHCLRSAAERTNSTLKQDNAILQKPSVRSLRRASVESLMGVITTLLDRVSRFVLDVTIKERKFKTTGDKAWLDQLSPPEVPSHLKPFVPAA